MILETKKKKFLYENVFWKLSVEELKIIKHHESLFITMGVSGLRES